jgi:hypothetical protein
MFINFRIFLLALASGFQPPWSLPSICRKPTKSSSSRLLHLACSQGDFRHPIGEILVRNPERSPVTGCHRILENLETDHLQSQNRSVRSPYPQNWLDGEPGTSIWLSKLKLKERSPAVGACQIFVVAFLGSGVEDSKIWERYEVWSFCNDFKPKIGQNMLEFDARFC